MVHVQLDPSFVAPSWHQLTTAELSFDSAPDAEIRSPAHAWRWSACTPRRWPFPASATREASTSTCTRWRAGWASAASRSTCSPARSPPNESGIVELNEHARVIHVAAGPPEPVAKEDLPELVPEFAAELDPRIGRLPGRALPLLALRHGRPLLAQQHTVPLVHTMHTMARVKNQALGSAPGHRTRRTRARAKPASSPTRPSSPPTPSTRPRNCSTTTGPAPSSWSWCRRVSTCTPSIRAISRSPAPSSESRQDAQVILFVGRIQPLKAPDVLDRGGRPAGGDPPIAPRPATAHHHRQSERPRGPLVDHAARAGSRPRRR